MGLDLAGDAEAALPPCSAEKGSKGHSSLGTTSQGTQTGSRGGSKGTSVTSVGALAPFLTSAVRGRPLRQAHPLPLPSPLPQAIERAKMDSGKPDPDAAYWN